MNLKNRTLFIADNLDIMRGIDSESVDLIYLDPPFNKKKRFKAPIGSPAEGATFKDIWTDEDVKEEWRGEIASRHQDLYDNIQTAGKIYDPSMAIYMTAMSVRLFEMRRILKKTGSIYLHCDQTANHYLKVCMDAIFGKNNFRNEIIWAYKGPSNVRRWFPRKHDVVLFYVKSRAAAFNADAVRIPYSESFTARRQYDEGEAGITAGYADGRTEEEVSELFGNGKIIEDWWDDIPSGGHISRKERTGWPTQKPLKLLDRVIKASSNEGDLVFDPFCGCATACVAAELLGRRWVGIDISASAEVITKYRLDEARHNLEGTQTFDPEADVIVLREPPKRTDIQIPKPIEHKPALYGKQNGECAGCKIHFPYRNMTIDHIRPRARGGVDTVDNLQLLCHACNSAKGTGTQEELIAKLRERGVIE